MNRSQSLDGIRGAAAIVVMAFHLKIPGSQIGLVMVPIFFVMSGYLVTRQLTGRTTTAEFFWRRGLRIIPLLYIYLLVNAIASAVVGLSLEGYGWHFAILSNEWIASRAPETPGGAIGQLWSVAVEAQFYLVWPFLLLAGRRVAIVAAASAFIGAAAFRLGIDNPYRATVSLLATMDLFAAGALIVLIRNHRAHIVAFVIGCVITSYSAGKFSYTDMALVPSWAPRAPFFFTGLALVIAPTLVWLADSRNAMLCWRPFCWTGRISYSLYLWHMLAFAVVHHILGSSAPVASMILAFVIGYVSWRGLERPIEIWAGKHFYRQGSGRDVVNQTLNSQC